MHYIYLADVYGKGTYSIAPYSSNQPVPTSGTLTDTGIAIAAVVTLACLIVLTAIIVKVWKRPSKTTPTE